MKFELMIKALRHGLKIRRKSWPAGVCVFEKGGQFVDSGGFGFKIGPHQIKLNDWEVVRDTKTVALYLYAFKDNCGNWKAAPRLYSSDEDFRAHYPRGLFKRLDNTKIEVETEVGGCEDDGDEK